MWKYLSGTTQSDISWLFQGIGNSSAFETFQIHGQLFIVSLLGNLPIKRPKIYANNKQLLGTCQI